MLCPRDEQLALQLFDIGAIKSKAQSPDGCGFKLKLHETQPNAPLSPFYLNLRTPDNPKPGPLTPNLVFELADRLFHDLEDCGIKFTCVAGLPNAGDPIAEAFVKAAALSGWEFRLLKLEKVTESDKRSITRITSGAYEAGESVLVIDDLITKADTKLEGIKILEDKGLNVCGVAVLVDREQGGKEELESRDYTLYYLFKVSDLLELYLDEEFIDQAAYDEIAQYLGLS